MNYQSQTGTVASPAGIIEAGLSDALELAWKIAPQFRIVECSSPEPEIGRLTKQIATPEKLYNIIAIIRKEVLTHLDRAPREALGLARVAYQLARSESDNIPLAETALTCAIASNLIGEYQAANSLGNQACTLFTQLGDLENAAKSICESAWAKTSIGDLRPALEDVESARKNGAAPLLRAQADWIQARILRLMSQYPEAIGLLEKAIRTFRESNLQLQAARCERDLVTAQIFSQSGKPLELLESVQRWFEAEQYPLDAARCNLVRSTGLIEAGGYSQAYNLACSAKRAFVELRADFDLACSDRNLGITLYLLNRYPESIEKSQAARKYFSEHDLRAEVSACDINLGAAYHWMNRYDEALAAYQSAYDLVKGEGREVRLVRICLNMGSIHVKQGRYAQALDLYQRALQLATAKDLPVLTAGCHAHLATCYRELGDYDRALRHELRRKEILLQREIQRPLIACNISLAEIYLAKGEETLATEYLEQARGMAVAQKLDTYLAACDRFLARIGAGSNERKLSFARVRNARRLYRKHGQMVDAASCDLIQADMYLQAKKVAAARKYYRRAQSVLSPGFPDQAWRAERGLGLCASLSRRRALDHHLSAVRTIAASRSALVTEQLSNDFFAHRQSVYDEALKSAIKENDFAAGLEVIDLGKARTFITLLGDRGSKSLRSTEDPYIAELIDRERELRDRLNALRREVNAPIMAQGIQRGVQIRETTSAAARRQLADAALAYESIASRLRLATKGVAGISAPAPFDLDQFRESMNKVLGLSWAGLDYYLSGDELTIAVVQPGILTMTQRKLSAKDRAILDQCVSTDSNIRKLVYRGIARHGSMSPPRIDYLSYLHDLLIPEGLDVETLLIAPHGSLHALPFHALMSSEGYLVKRHRVVYTPCLQVSQLLCNEPVMNRNAEPLVLGLSNFGDRMPGLTWSGAEVENIINIFERKLKVLWGVRATRKKLFELNSTGELQKYGLLHFATHAIFDRTAPHQSSVFLHDDTLTALDVLDLTLNARLVSLSACQTALGKGGRGDEALSLTRAFLYAGAKALLATLWHVEDETLVGLTKSFFQGWSRGKDAASALSDAAIESIHEGKPPYCWASFMLIGRP